VIGEGNRGVEMVTGELKREQRVGEGDRSVEGNRGVEKVTGVEKVEGSGEGYRGVEKVTGDWRR
jgi:hypothetical protein